MTRVTLVVPLLQVYLLNCLLFSVDFRLVTVIHCMKKELLFTKYLYRPVWKNGRGRRTCER